MEHPVQIPRPPRTPLTPPPSRRCYRVLTAVAALQADPGEILDVDFLSDEPVVIARYPAIAPTTLARLLELLEVLERDGAIRRVDGAPTEPRRARLQLV